MDKPFQRRGAKSNAHVGKEFEIKALDFFNSKKNLTLQRNIKTEIGVEDIKKPHAFDLGCLEKKILVECKSHTWTSGANVPSAKLTVWNEAMYYFLVTPKKYRKIMFVLKDFSEKRNETLAQYYLRSYKHLIPSDVELWEYDDSNSIAEQIKN